MYLNVSIYVYKNIAADEYISCMYVKNAYLSLTRANIALLTPRGFGVEVHKLIQTAWSLVEFGQSLANIANEFIETYGSLE